MDAEFRRLNDAQFKRVTKGLQDLGRLYIREIASFAVEVTPGFGNQQPEDTLYIPVGRLRGGWNHTRTPLLESTKGLNAKRHEDGPFSDYGHETVDRITEQLAADRMGGISYLENDVGYGDIIVHGKGRHRAVGPRNFPQDAATKTAQERAARIALQGVGRQR